VLKVTFVDLGGEIGAGYMRGRRSQSWDAEMRLDTLKIAGRAPYGPHKQLEGDKRGWNDDHRGEYEQFKYIDRDKHRSNRCRKGTK
jgi:hypothetical protein